MIDVIVLLIIQIILILIALYRTKFNIGIPSNIMMCFLTVGYVFYALGYKTWENTLKQNTFWVILCGYMIAFISSMVCKRITTPRSQKMIDYYSRDLNNEKNVKLLFLISTVFFILYVLGIAVAGKSFGLSFAHSIAYVKSVGGEGVNTISRQGFKVVSMASYIAVFLYIYNLKNKIYRKNTTIKIIFMIVYGMVITIIAGSRGDILKIFSAIIFVYFLFFKPREINMKKFVRTIIIAVVAIFAVFYGSRTIVKTFSNEYSGALGFLDYICYYIGSSFEVLNIKLQNISSYHSSYFGYFTFAGFYDILTNLGFDFSDIGIIGSEHVYLGSYNFGGNVATSFFDVIADFGYIGMLLMAFECFLGNYVYSQLMRNKSKFSIIYFSQLYSIFTFSFYSGTLKYYTDMTSIYSLVVLLFLYCLTFKVKIKNKYINNA